MPLFGVVSSDWRFDCDEVKIGIDLDSDFDFDFDFEVGRNGSRSKT